MISIEVLRQFPEFANLDDEELRSIAAISEQVTFAKGQEILREGNLADRKCLLLSGEVNVVYRLGDDRLVVADTLVRGDFFGWSALLEPHRLTATCVGNKPGEYLSIQADGLRRLCQEDAVVGRQVLQEVAKTLRDRLSALRVQIAASQ